MEIHPKGFDLSLDRIRSLLEKLGNPHARIPPVIHVAGTNGKGSTIAFCRAMNIPARYCTGYISDVGVPPPHAPMDFAAWIEVFLGGEWRVFDPRNNMPMRGRILIAHGRDAADVPLTHSFGKSELTDFRVWIAPADIA